LLISDAIVPSVLIGLRGKDSDGAQNWEMLPSAQR
jgi:hypothetical protein